MDLDPRQNDPVNSGIGMVFAIVKIRIHDISLKSKYTFCMDLDLAVGIRRNQDTALDIDNMNTDPEGKTIR